MFRKGYLIHFYVLFIFWEQNKNEALCSKILSLEPSEWKPLLSLCAPLFGSRDRKVFERTEGAPSPKAFITVRILQVVLLIRRKHVYARTKSYLEFSVYIGDCQFKALKGLLRWGFIKMQLLVHGFGFFDSTYVFFPLLTRSWRRFIYSHRTYT